MSVSFFLSAIFFGLAALLIGYQIAIRIKAIRNAMCKFGWHQYKKKKKHLYRCSFCKKPKDHLTVIDGGKKGLK